MRKLITTTEVGALARPCFADDTIIERLILESMREEIKPRIGDALFIDLTAGDSEDDLSDDLRFLLNGGAWSDSNGTRRYLTGLKTALAYFVYARVIRDGNIQSTRYGARIKTDDNSINSEDSERQRQYRQAFQSADAYLAECLAFINARLCSCASGSSPRVMRSNRTRFRVIGADDCDTARRASAPVQIVRPEYEFMTSAEIAALFNK